MTGKLYLIPSFLGSENSNEVFPELNRTIVSQLKYFIVEEERTTRRFLKKLVPEIIIDHLNFKLLNEHTNEVEISSYLSPIETESIGLISEAGVPCVADPGSTLVKLAHEKNIEVMPLIGPSSILLALMASGLNGQNFAFNGYLPIKKDEKVKVIKSFEKRSFQENQSQIFIEAPYRNNQLIEDITMTCEPNTLLCIACDLTLPSQFIKTATIREWKNKKPDIHKRPAIFILKKTFAN
jgi:16S rRNA (cytidine1402-2'-O)-methyltransferase